ncbi:glycosyltransferase family 31 protein [Didymella exigua CBS 183.55]|uniref:N-acetylgalactosaminide beta-1,3-galactosyltransferase n=1 Tax=Didymella exigua CBS 183.55 TaxID=1150837 RepID=A0A6A5RWW1_9PLEO|nr:glycosyltransferase family 31 protein [Didymella exigua CBS 183.55]KAF1932049.1 glycosyltransferase family 31 protein [Didymella exigua CBS 183.55]
MDECFLFPKHLREKVQVVLKTGVADAGARTNAMVNTIIKCINNVLVISDQYHKYGPHNAVDVLADLPAMTYMREEDYEAYEAQKNATCDGVELHQGHEGWKIDKYKFLPAVERAIQLNRKAEWYIFLESDTYLFWDNVYRMLDNYDSSVPHYFGSPSPGKKHRPDSKSEHEEQIWFANGGCGFILSTAAAHRLVDRPHNAVGVQGPRLTIEYEDDIRNDCCGDSILGWALHDKAGVDISGLWPMFNPRGLEDVPFGKDYWCEPVITLHKTDPHQHERPLLYKDLLFSYLGNFSQRDDWDAAFDAGFQLDVNSTVHSSLDACEAGCFAHHECQQYTWHGAHCYYLRALYIGRAKEPDGYHEEEDRKYVSGWDINKIQTWSLQHTCEEGLHWVKPSVKRIY